MDKNSTPTQIRLHIEYLNEESRTTGYNMSNLSEWNRDHNCYGDPLPPKVIKCLLKIVLPYLLNNIGFNPNYLTQKSIDKAAGKLLK